MGKFEKGNPGKPKGAENKLKKTFKELLHKAIDSLQDDPKANLEAWAKENPTEFYKIAAKLIPQDLKAQVETSEVIVKVIRENNTTGTSDTPSGTTTSTS